jgi:hypothetical protein
MLVGCFFLAGNTLRMYRSPTLKSANLLSVFSSPSIITFTSASGSIVKKNGNEYRSSPVLFRTRCTAARKRPLVCRSKYWPTLQTRVLGRAGTEIHCPVGVRTSRALRDDVCKTSVRSVFVSICAYRFEGNIYTKSPNEHRARYFGHHCPGPRAVLEDNAMVSYLR